MKAHKYSKDIFGDWNRDSNNLPCYEFSTASVPWYTPPLQHVIGTGKLILLADQYGQFRLYSSVDGTFSCLNAMVGDTYTNAVCLAILDRDSGVNVSFNPGNFDTSVCWGIGYLSLFRQLELSQSLGVKLSLAAVPGSGFLALELDCHNAGTAAARLKLQFFSTFNPQPAELFATECGLFARDGAALVTDAHPLLGDFFLAGSTAWSAEAETQLLKLQEDIEIDAGATISQSLLLGMSEDCSIDWLQQQFADHSFQTAVLAWSEKVGSEKNRAPELWMQEECLWHRGRVRMLTASEAKSDRYFLLPGGAEFFRSEKTIGAETPTSIRDMMTLAMAVTAWDKELAYQTLLKVAQGQLKAGKLPEQHGLLPGEKLRSHSDRSDLELWFLVAWCGLIRAGAAENFLDQAVPFANQAEGCIWDHICAAYSWIRDKIRQGSHDLLRICAGDSNAYLNLMGPAGKGESVLNTALACYALPQLIELARRRDQVSLADEMAAWHQSLRLAVGEAFDQKWFRRGYTDDGRAVGTFVEERIFTDVQAWCVLARCGTVRQREQALQSTLAAQTVAPAITTLSKPYPLLAPRDITDLRIPAGDAENGGVSLPIAAWFIWALAQEGHTELALKEWQRLSVRQRAAETDGVPGAWLLNCSTVASSLAHARAGQNSIQAVQNCNRYPEAHAAAWYEFALRKILS